MPAKPSAELFHAVAADLDYPMAVVTTAYGGERAGCLVGFTAQCSIDPPLFVVWLSNKNHTTRLALQAPSLLVHFLSRDQRQLARLFGAVSGDEVDKLALCRWQPGPEGLPRLSECSRWIAGHILERFQTGDHVGHVLDPFDGAAGDWPGQLGFQSVKDLEAGQPV